MNMLEVLIEKINMEGDESSISRPAGGKRLSKENTEREKPQNKKFMNMNLKLRGKKY